MYAKWNTLPPNGFANVQLRNNLCPQLFCSSNSHWHLLWEFVLGDVFSKPKYYLSSGRTEVGSQVAEGRIEKPIRGERLKRHVTQNPTEATKSPSSCKLHVVYPSPVQVLFSSFPQLESVICACLSHLHSSRGFFTLGLSWEHHYLSWVGLFSNTSIKWSENALWFCT